MQQMQFYFLFNQVNAQTYQNATENWTTIHRLPTTTCWIHAGIAILHRKEVGERSFLLSVELYFTILSSFIIYRLPFGDYFIGREGKDWNFLNVPSARASKIHCRIECLNNGDVFLHDCGSTNGTFVGGQRYTGATIKLEVGTIFGECLIFLL